MCPDIIDIPDATTTIKGKVKLGINSDTAADLVVQTNDSRLSDSRTPTGSPSSGDLTGTYPNPTVTTNAITFAKMADVATDRLIGRDTAATGDPEALTVSGGIEFTGSGGIQTSAFTGDVTKTAGGTATTIANDAVSYAKMQNVSATNRVLGRITAGAGDTEELTGTQVTSLIDAATTSASGKVELATSGENAANVVVQGNDSRLSDSRAPNGSASGDLAGTYPSPTVAQSSTAFAFTGVISPTDATDQNNYNPTNLSTSYEIRWNGTASIKLTGLAGGASGRELLITNVTTDYLLWLENQNTSSTAANRFILPQGFPAFLFPNDSILLRYDNTTQRWRVKNWATQGVCMGLTKFDDFLQTPSTTVTTGDWGGVASGTGAAITGGTYLENTTEKPFGTIELSTGTTTTGRASVSPATGKAMIPTLGPALTICRLAIEVAVDGTNTYTITTGFNDNVAGATDGVTWEYRWTGSAAEWSQTRWAAATPTRSNTGSPTPTTNYVWLAIFMNAAWTRADFIYSDDSISFTKSASPTTGLPNNTQLTSPYPCNIIKSAGTTARLVSLDCFGYRVDYVRG